MMKRSSEIFTLLNPLRRGIWLVGVSSWLFGISDRSIAALSDGFLSAWDLIQLFTASFFFLGWVLLKPDFRRR
jgi:hypothetical protein